jgi:hypothetical protein
MPDIKGWISRRRYGGITGLNQMDSNVKMMGIGLAPLIGMILFNQFFIMGTPLEQYSWLVTILALVVEVGWIGILYMRASNDANRLIVFPQTHMRFPDGTSRWFDLKTRAGLVEEICEFEDKSKGYRVQFLDRFEHQDKKLPYPYVFQSMYWRAPAAWADSFERLCEGECFHGNVYVDIGSCEPLTLWVKDIPETEDGFEPLCYVSDSSFQYKQWLRNDGHDQKTPSTDVYMMPFRKAQKKVSQLLEHTLTLETALQVEREAKGMKFRKQVDGTLNTIREGVHTIDDTSEPLINRIFKLQNIGIILLIIGVILFSHFFLGWP